MSHVESPAWLIPAFERAAVAAGATASPAAISSAAARLLDRWEDPRRHFHNVRHLVDLLQRVDELQQEAHDAHSVRLAAWYHGAVFDSDAEAAYAKRGGEDEAASAEYARTELAALGVPSERIADVATMVEALARHSILPASMDCAVLCDADLSILAADPQKYRKYLADIRAEYAHIPERRFLESRRAIVSKLLKRDRLYLSPMSAGWEGQARQNLQAELSRIDRDLAVVED